MKRKCEEDTNVLVAILSHDEVFVNNCETDTVKENVDRFTLFKQR